MRYFILRIKQYKLFCDSDTDMINTLFFMRTSPCGIRHCNHEVVHIEGIILYKHNYSSVIGLAHDAVDPDQITTTRSKRVKPIPTYNREKGWKIMPC